MAWPYSDTPTSLPPVDLSGLGQYGQQAPVANSLASMGNTSFNTQVDVTGTQSSGGFNPMEIFKSLFNQESAFGGTNLQTNQQTMGWAMPSIGLLSGVMGMMGSRQQMANARDQLKESRRQFDLNYGAQRQSMNTELEDRQRARVASNSGAYQGVDEYMDKNRIR